MEKEGKERSDEERECWEGDIRERDETQGGGVREGGEGRRK